MFFQQIVLIVIQVSGIDLSKQEVRLKDKKRKFLIVIGIVKKIFEIVDKDFFVVRYIKIIVIDEVDKVFLSFYRKILFKKLIYRENYFRLVKLLVEKIFKIFKVSGFFLL